MRNQVSVELLSLVGILSLVLVLVVVLSFVISQQLNTQKTSSGGADLCVFLATEVNTAASLGEGYERSFVMPFVYTQFPYSIEFDNNERRVGVSWSGGGCSTPLLANVSGAVSQGPNFMRFENGVVVLN
ncbi:MAG: hypothetical protein QXR53_03520 [Candidatus Norongarragalinales archaeon]